MRSDHAADLSNDFLFTSEPAPRPTEWFLSIHTGEPDDGNEVKGKGYERQAVKFSKSSNRAVTNTSDMTFGPALANPWGTVTHIAIWDAPKGGRMLDRCKLGMSRTIQVGEGIQFPPSAIKLSQR